MRYPARAAPEGGVAHAVQKRAGAGCGSAIVLAAGTVLRGAIWAGLRCLQLLYGA